MNIKIIIMIIFSILVAPNVFAQGNEGNVVKREGSTPKDKWEILDDLEKEKEDIFNKYQQDKKDMQGIFDREKMRILNEGSDDYQYQIRSLTKEYNKNKKRLLRNFRQANKRLSIKENNLKGHRSVDQVRNDASRRIRKNSYATSALGRRTCSPKASVRPVRKTRYKRRCGRSSRLY